MKKRSKKTLLALLVAAVIVAVRLSGILDYLTLEDLRNQGELLRSTVNSQYPLAVLIYVVGYAVAVAVAIPGDIVLSLAGGYLFGTLLGALYINVGSTCGALLSFLFSRYVAGDWVQRRYGDRLTGFNGEVEVRGYIYFFIVRLIPLFPFVLVNLLSGLTRVPLRTYIWTTSLGTLPVTLIYTYAGAQLGAITETGAIPTGRMMAALILLAGLAALPLVVKKLRTKEARQ